MRKLLIITAMVAVALGGAAACANKPASPSPSTSAAAADETKAVCTEATTASASAITTLKAKLAEGTQAFLAGDTAKVAAAQAAAKTTATEWTTKLTQLSAKNIKPEVKTVLTNGVTTITTLVASFGTTSSADAEAKLTDFTTKLAAACASA
jgi:hypothetical protein